MLIEDPFSIILLALEEVKVGSSYNVNFDSHLRQDGILDSLDLMSFLFRLECKLGYQLPQIDESFEDFRVKTLIKFIKELQE